MVNSLFLIVGLAFSSIETRTINFVYSFDNVLLSQNQDPSDEYDNYSIVSCLNKILNAEKFIGIDETSLIPPYIGSYTNALQISSSTYFYNCHSFAWLYDGDIDCVPNSTDDLYWVDYPNSLYKTNEYPNCATYNHYTNPSTITNMSLINVGDIVVYYDITDQWFLKIAHSAVVISVGSSISNVIVRSKWRHYGVYEHPIFECPYYSCAVESNNPGIQSSPETPIDICHVNHTFVYKTANSYYHYYETTCCGKTKRSPHTFVHSGIRYVCSVCGYASFDPYKSGE